MFLSTVITDDGSWVYGYDPETKRWSSQLKSVTSPRPKKARQVKSNLKSMISLSLTSRGLCTKNLSQQAELWILGSTAKLCGYLVKKYEDIAPNFGENRPGCFTMTTPRLTLPSSPTSFWRKTKLLLSPTHRTPLIWHPVTSSYFQKWNWSWKDASSIPLRRSRPNRRECLTLWQKRTSRKRSKNGADGGTGVYMREGTTSRVTAADRPYGEFCDFYSVSLENFGSTLVYWDARSANRKKIITCVYGNCLEFGMAGFNFLLGDRRSLLIFITLFFNPLRQVLEKCLDLDYDCLQRHQI